jgi:hypothetical protein
MRRTGRRIPDCQLPTFTNAHHVWTKLSSRNHPTLASQLAASPAHNQSNLTLRSKPVTQLQEDLDVGRWRSICRALEARGLPLEEMESERTVDDIIDRGTNVVTQQAEFERRYMPGYQWVSERKHEKLVTARRFRAYQKRIDEEMTLRGTMTRAPGLALPVFELDGTFDREHKWSEVETVQEKKKKEWESKMRRKSEAIRRKDERLGRGQYSPWNEDAATVGIVAENAADDVKGDFV